MKKVLAIILSLLFVFSLVACGQEEPQNDDPKGNEPTGIVDATEYELIPFLKDYAQYKTNEEMNVLYLVCTTYAEYFPNSYAVWEPVLKEAGISMELLGPPEYSDASLIATLESCLQTGDYDAVVLYPITPQAITPMLQNIWDTYEVPIVAYAFDPSTECGHYYMGTSYYSAGTTLGKSIVEYVDNNAEHFGSMDSIPVVVYKNSAGAEQYARVQGAMDVLKKDGRFKIIEEYEANNEAVCMAQTETVLNMYPDVEIFLTQIDNDVTGTYQTMISGVYPVSEYASVWGFDATGAVCALMAQDGKDGFVQGSALIDHYKAADLLKEFLPIVVGAAKQGVLIDFTQEQFDYLGTILSNYYVTVTPENVSQYYTAP